MVTQLVTINLNIDNAKNKIMLIFSIDVVPELYQLAEAKEGRNHNSIAWIEVGDTMKICCDEYWMMFEWDHFLAEKSEDHFSERKNNVKVSHNIDDELTENTFAAALFQNSFFVRDDWPTDPEVFITQLKNNMKCEFASAILSDLASDLLANFKRVTDST